MMKKLFTLLALVASVSAVNAAQAPAAPVVIDFTAEVAPLNAAVVKAQTDLLAATDANRAQLETALKTAQAAMDKAIPARNDVQTVTSATAQEIEAQVKVLAAAREAFDKATTNDDKTARTIEILAAEATLNAMNASVKLNKPGIFSTAKTHVANHKLVYGITAGALVVTTAAIVYDLKFNKNSVLRKLFKKAPVAPAAA